MNKRITFLKSALFVFAIAITSSLTLYAQAPLVHLKFENNLNDDGTLGLTFIVGGADSAGVSVPFGTGTDAHEGMYAINFTAIGDTSDPNYSLIQNGGNFDAQIMSTGNLGITDSAARTVSAWIRYDDRNPDTKGTHVIANLGLPTAAAASYARNTFQLAGANNRLQLGIGGGTMNFDYEDGTLVEDGGWHQVAWTYPAGGTLADVTFYVDGDTVVTDGGGANGGFVFKTPDDVVHIGTRGTNAQKWFDGGGIDDLRIYDYELTPEDMAIVFAGGNVGIEDVAFDENEIKAYPNAVIDILHLETTSNTSLDINVFDIDGKLLIKTSGNKVDMSGLAAGLYVVKVREDNKVANLKILKE